MNTAVHTIHIYSGPQCIRMKTDIPTSRTNSEIEVGQKSVGGERQALVILVPERKMCSRP